jgi:hypothetical protein
MGVPYEAAMSHLAAARLCDGDARNEVVRRATSILETLGLDPGPLVAGELGQVPR